MRLFAFIVSVDRLPDATLKSADLTNQNARFSAIKLGQFFKKNFTNSVPWGPYLTSLSEVGPQDGPSYAVYVC